MSDSNKLNLPSLNLKTGIKKKTEEKIAPFKTKQNQVLNKILRSEGSNLKDTLQKKAQGLDLVLVGDLTGSMTQYHELLKSKFKVLSRELFGMIKNLRIGIIFYLDHDEHLPYVTRICELSTDIEKICHFIEQTPVATHNATFDEAVEDALNDLSKNIKWREISNRSVVLFGDAAAHPQDGNPYNLSFWEITRDLYNSSTVINSVYCGDNQVNSMQEHFPTEVGDFSQKHDYLGATNFFSWIANVTGGMAISVENVDDLIDIIVASAAKDAGQLDDLEEKFKHQPKRLNLIKIAKKAQTRKLEADKKIAIGYKK